jgi:hypothetical protein
MVHISHDFLLCAAARSRGLSFHFYFDPGVPLRSTPGFMLPPASRVIFAS